MCVYTQRPPGCSACIGPCRSSCGTIRARSALPPPPRLPARFSIIKRPDPVPEEAFLCLGRPLECLRLLGRQCSPRPLLLGLQRRPIPDSAPSFAAASSVSPRRTTTSGDVAALARRRLLRRLDGRPWARASSASLVSGTAPPTPRGPPCWPADIPCRSAANRPLRLPKRAVCWRWAGPSTGQTAPKSCRPWMCKGQSHARSRPGRAKLAPATPTRWPPPSTVGRHPGKIVSPSPRQGWPLPSKVGPLPPRQG